MSKNEIDQITTSDPTESPEEHYWDALMRLRACDPEALRSFQDDVDLETITQQFEMLVERNFVGSTTNDHLTYRRYRCEGCDTVRSFPGAPGFCEDCDTWQAEWTDLGKDKEENDDGD